MKKTILTLLLLMVNTMMMLAQYSVMSPDESISVNIQQTFTKQYNSKFRTPDKIKMTVTINGDNIVNKREIDITIKSHGKRYSFSKSPIKTHNIKSGRTLKLEDDPDGLLSLFDNRYNSIYLETETGIGIDIYVFDNGVAYRYRVNGHDDEYKILNKTNILPSDAGLAILGTYTGKKVLPWSTLLIDNDGGYQNLSMAYWNTEYPSTKIVSWKDALSSFSIGFSFNSMSGKTWGNTGETSSLNADFTYKYIYGGLSFTPCQEIQYIYFEKDFAPFDGIVGSIHSWDITGKLGFSLPLQCGSDVWNFTPFGTATYLNLRQHGPTHPLFHALQNRDHYLLGMGMKISYTMKERITVGIGYERQFFTGTAEPSGRNVYSLTMGYTF